MLAIIPLESGWVSVSWTSGKASILKARLAADFTGWEKNSRKFNAQVDRIATALRARSRKHARSLPYVNRKISTRR